MAVIKVEVDDQLLRDAQAVAASSCMDLLQVIQYLFLADGARSKAAVPALGSFLSSGELG